MNFHFVAFIVVFIPSSHSFRSFALVEFIFSNRIFHRFVFCFILCSFAFLVHFVSFNHFLRLTSTRRRWLMSDWFNSRFDLLARINNCRMTLMFQINNYRNGKSISVSAAVVVVFVCWNIDVEVMHHSVILFYFEPRRSFCYEFNFPLLLFHSEVVSALCLYINVILTSHTLIDFHFSFGATKNENETSFFRFYFRIGKKNPNLLRWINFVSRNICLLQTKAIKQERSWKTGEFLRHWT